MRLENEADISNSEGEYLQLSNGQHFNYRFEILSKLGQGSFGSVVKVLDHKTKKEMALKVIRNKKKFNEQALVEIKLLEHI